MHTKSASVGSLKSADPIARTAAVVRPEMKDTFRGIHMPLILAFRHDHVFSIVYIYIYIFIKNYPELLISIYKISLQKCSSSMGTDGSEVFGCRLVTEVDGEPSAIPYSLATNIS